MTSEERQRTDKADLFDITGLFYERRGFKCRKYLNIKKKTCARKSPDLLVVMMNPGQSKSLHGLVHDERETKAIPDRTQIQIMRVMRNCGFDYSRILNLSDVRETRSGEFYRLLPLLSEKKTAHSIFDPRRKNDFEDLFVRDVPVILAWGVHGVLKDLALMAIERIGSESVFGLKKEGEELAYYHPLPPNYYKQEEWVKRITAQVKSARIHV
jgi:hypothetical protein